MSCEEERTCAEFWIALQDFFWDRWGNLYTLCKKRYLFCQIADASATQITVKNPLKKQNWVIFMPEKCMNEKKIILVQ